MSIPPCIQIMIICMCRVCRVVLSQATWLTIQVLAVVYVALRCLICKDNINHCSRVTMKAVFHRMAVKEVYVPISCICISPYSHHFTPVTNSSSHRADTRRSLCNGTVDTFPWQPGYNSDFCHPTAATNYVAFPGSSPRSSNEIITRGTNRDLHCLTSWTTR